MKHEKLPIDLSNLENAHLHSTVILISKKVIAQSQ